MIFRLAFKVLHAVNTTIEQHWHVRDPLSMADKQWMQERIDHQQERLRALRTEINLIRHEIQDSEETGH